MTTPKPGHKLSLTELERRVLLAWRDMDEDASVLTFADVADETGIAKPRRYVRALARKGLLYHERMWDGYRECVAGSGYCPTLMGLEVLRQITQESAHEPAED